MERHFKSPWSAKVKALSVLFVVIVIVAGLSTRSRLITLGLVATIPLCLAFSVRGYTIEEGKLTIHRFGWKTVVDLRGLVRVEHDPQAMSGSIRTFGIGGLFSRLGAYRAYATDTDNAVMGETAAQCIVVTPEFPAEFVKAVQTGAVAV